MRGKGSKGGRTNQASLLPSYSQDWSIRSWTVFEFQTLRITMRLKLFPSLPVPTMETSYWLTGLLGYCMTWNVLRPIATPWPREHALPGRFGRSPPRWTYLQSKSRDRVWYMKRVVEKEDKIV
jgi:hypothetical protein